jgi:hypothetical protein
VKVFSLFSGSIACSRTCRTSGVGQHRALLGCLALVSCSDADRGPFEVPRSEVATPSESTARATALKERLISFHVRRLDFAAARPHSGTPNARETLVRVVEPSGLALESNGERASTSRSFGSSAGGPAAAAQSHGAVHAQGSDFTGRAQCQLGASESGRRCRGRRSGSLRRRSRSGIGCVPQRFSFTGGPSWTDRRGRAGCVLTLFLASSATTDSGKFSSPIREHRGAPECPRPRQAAQAGRQGCKT